MTIHIPSEADLIRTASELASERFSPGIDDMSSHECLNYIIINAKSILGQLTTGSYKPKPALSFTILRKNGKERTVYRLSALDLIIQRCFAHSLSEYCETIFSNYSHAYRPGRGTNTAISQYIGFAGEFSYVSRVDIKNCFESIDHHMLLHKVNSIIENTDFLNVLAVILNIPIADENGISENSCGLLQGAPISPVLCNLFLSDLDSYLTQSGISFCRYADDVVMFSHDEDEAIRFTDKAAAYINSELHLTVNSEKLLITGSENLTFLGYGFHRTDDGRIFASESEEKHIVFNNRWVHDCGISSDRKTDILSDGILSKKDFTLLFEGEQSAVIPVKSINHINIYSSVTLAPQALKVAADNGVTINFFDRYGHLLGRFEPVRRFCDVSLELAQLQAYNRTGTTRKLLSKNMLLSSLHNIRLNIRYYKKQTGSKKCEQALLRMDAIEKEIKKCSQIDNMRLLEAQMRELYYSCFNEFIKDSRYRFDKRTRRPPMDELNSLISFGNTFLYNLIAMEINKTSLDIRIGFLHSTTSRSESLNLDIADIFKPLIVDRAIFTMINKRMISFETHFQHESNGAVYLTKDGKRLFLDALYNKLGQQISVGEEKLTYHQLIIKDIRSLSSSLKGKNKYKGFRQVR